MWVSYLVRLIKNINTKSWYSYIETNGKEIKNTKQYKITYFLKNDIKNPGIFENWILLNYLEIENVRKLILKASTWALTLPIFVNAKLIKWLKIIDLSETFDKFDLAQIFRWKIKWLQQKHNIKRYWRRHMGCIGTYNWWGYKARKKDAGKFEKI